MVNLYIIYQNMYYQSRKRKTCTTELFYYWNNSNRSLFQRAQRRDRHILVLTWAVSNQSIPTKEGGGNSAYWPNGTPSLFLYSPQAYNVFYISGWKKRNTVTCEKVLSEQRTAWPFVESCLRDASSLCLQSWVIDTDWPTKPKIFTVSEWEKTQTARFGPTPLVTHSPNASWKKT